MDLRVEAPEPATGPVIGQFAVASQSSLQERRPRVLKHGDTFAVFDRSGDLLSGEGSPDGLFHRDTRYLSHLDLLVDGARPILLSSSPRDDNSMLTCDLTNPDLHDGTGRLVLEHDLVHVRRSKFLWNGTCFERLLVRNFDDRPRRLSVALRFEADFADLFEVRGTRRRQRGSFHPAEVGTDTVVLSYTGLDGRRRSTILRFDPAPARLEAGGALFDIDVAPGGRSVIFMEVRCDDGLPPEGAETQAAPRPLRDRFLSSMVEARRALRRSSSKAAAVETSNDIFNEAVRRCVADLYMLVTDTPQGPYPYAGTPWFSAAFGRDALITAYMALWADPSLARGVLRFLAANQAKEENRAADAEPGKILHEVRYGEMAELGEVPFRRYYGSVDATPLFVLLAGAYLERTGDVATLHGLWPHMEAALRWIDAYGDRDGDGFVEYGRRTEEGLLNQGWKDSHDSIFHADGAMARGPIALCEVQAYVYAAKRAAAAVAARLGLPDRARALESEAESLKERFDRAFWCEDLGTYGLALDGGKRLCRVRSSNAGHALFTGIALPERAARLAETLMDRTSFSGWGVRTVAATEARYNPMSYHNGSVWPHDNALIALGLARYGFKREAARIFDGLFRASIYIDLRRLPELFCGFPRRRGEGPTFYPVACAPQAWAAASPLSLIQACLGLDFDPATRTIRLDRPVLPDFLDEIVLRNLAVEEGRLDLAVRRAGGEVAPHVLRRTGDVRVEITA
ncbi:amylo-alpha-1,6-glucosidase [Microvirga thermotolerans]|uniref:Amylo-alpha-1,6-glucosidase n=1 Tax=Microvirga thermotolerans TaxID=2651334 RepID=A0A5P9JTD1_9HYPH|nr:amylo-alpha-1,6-glucosidase [Microvirga thermotolerans]QFU15038.1 amylo-alpha-1,6-glucosidase [Microvirga thermotolerans]